MQTVLVEDKTTPTVVAPKHIFMAEEINREYLLEAIYIAAVTHASSDPVVYLDSTYTIPLNDGCLVVLDDAGKQAYMRIHRTITSKKRYA